MGTADAIRVIQAGVVEAPRLEVDNAFGGVLLHVLLAAEHDGAGRAGLHTGGLQPYRDAVGTQGALVGFVILLRNPRNVERATGDAVAATDAVVLVEVDDAVGVLDDRAWARTSLQATGLGAVHAAVLADQPLQVTVGIFMLGEAHQGPGLGPQVMRVIVSAVAVPHLVTQLVPFRAGDLAGLATDALGGVDQLGHLLLLADRRRRRGGGRTGDDVLASHQIFSTLTRNDFDSGVCVLPSPRNGTRVLVR
ncbi:hypothetical protein D3C78_1211120 [compost metagenome]